MKAFEIREFGIEKLALVDREVPKPGPRDVLVRLRAASLNYRDYMVVSGTYNPRMKLPAVPLSDGAGEIVEVGSEITEWKPGDRVMPLLVQKWFDGPPSAEKRRTSLGAGADWDGVLREFACFDADSVLSIPDHLSFEEASTLPCAALTAWNALLVSGKIRPGQSVLTLGSGGVSIFALQFAKLAGAFVISTSSDDEKLARLKQLGADEVINYRAEVTWDKKVIELTGGSGVDHVVEVGGAGTLPRSVNAAAFGGHIAMIGALSEGQSFDPIQAFMKAVRLQGIFIGSKKMFLEMNKAIAANEFHPVIDRMFNMEEIGDALEYLKGGSHFGKLVIRIQ
ncbi:zinc-dependent alcohol dehydrogenase family protein [Leptolyngbya sp. 7M]|uniref:zinc-dependent alcohol dehydrogenase family protein n=1 Tax=Leptolyngbya sp. 7M TaxID=2812896 RepID=UPI001B8A943E|nr:NAD(P)-dependent alcohol dehydrogenase [Leptolyngbya sp. 7M]QYO66750.1 NAD(P)-dependent alcohol dehydrogenase [Leptolyngbya sp. 7M]